MEKTRRIQVLNRRFGHKAGLTFLAVKEYPTEHGGRLSFGVAIPEEITPKAIREMILQRITPKEQPANENS